MPGLAADRHVIDLEVKQVDNPLDGGFPVRARRRELELRALSGGQRQQAEKTGGILALVVHLDRNSGSLAGKPGLERVASKAPFARRTGRGRTLQR